MEHNMNAGFSGDEASWVLSLPAQPREGASRSSQQSITQQRGGAPVGGSYLASNYVVDVIVVDAGEAVSEKFHSYFQFRGRFPSQFRGHSCLGVILSADGTISHPRINVQGSAVLYEVQLSGSLKLTFCDPDGGVFGGPVIGPLIAATRLQVAVLIFIHDA